MIWNILKIEATKDKRAITRAYREQLSLVNPEDKPEEFKLLRSAYEEALAYAAREEAEVSVNEMEGTDNKTEGADNKTEGTHNESPGTKNKSKTPVELWTNELEALYFDLPSRLDPICWKKLLSQDVCMALDTRPQVEEALLRFIMDNFRIPHKIWLLLDEEFQFMEEINRLAEQYPQDFLRYIVVGGIRNEDTFPLELFAEGTAGQICDAYLQVYYQLSNNFQEGAEAAAKLKAMPTKHPYGEALLARYASFNGDETALERMREISAAYPDDMSLLTDLTVMLFQAGSYEEAVEHADRILETDPDQATALKVKAYSFVNLERFSEASELINKLMALADGNQREIADLQGVLQDINEKLIQSNVQKLEDGLAEEDTAFELVWAYLQNGMPDQALLYLPQLVVDYPNPGRYHRTRFLVLRANGRKEEALEVMRGLLELLHGDEAEAQQSENPKDLERWHYRMADMLIEYSELFLSMGRNEEACQILKQAEEHAKNSAECWSRITQILLVQNKYEEALQTAEMVIEHQPNSAHGYLLQARAAFAMYQDNVAFRAVNEALELDGSDLFAYLLKLRILVRNDAREQAESLIAFLEENGITEDITVRWCKAMLMPSDDVEAVYAAYQEIEEVILKLQEEGQPLPDWLPDFYYRMAIALAGVKDAKKDYSRDDLHALLDKGLAADPEDFDCLEYKAWLFGRDDRNTEAIEIYLQLEKRPRRNLYVEKQLAELYYDERFDYADLALKYESMLEEEQADVRDHQTRMGHIYYMMQEFELAEERYLRALEISVNDPWVYHLMTSLYISWRKLDQAESCARKALQYHKEKGLGKGETNRVYWMDLAQVLSLQRKPEEAVAVYEECREECSHYTSYWKNVADVYHAAGLWEPLDRLLHAWEESGEDPEQWVVAVITTYLLKGEFERADQAMSNCGRPVPADKQPYLKAYLSAHMGDFRDYIAYRKDSLDRELKTRYKGDNCHQYENCAFGNWLQGNLEEAVKLAEAGWEEYQIYLEKYDLYQPIHIGSASVCLALLGRLEEARELVKKMDTAPLCWTCRYPICKDRFLYSAEIELIAGDMEKARMYLDRTREADPSEECLILCEGYLNSKREGTGV
ncbi:MAG: tetratricopeptide repeat protein [Lachnospiraceae bacterium]|nr:tetratricopeptide repeat protein [Lachnospiraceae bacterium]